MKHDVQHYFSGECVNTWILSPLSHFRFCSVQAIEAVDVAELGLGYFNILSMIGWSFSILYTSNIFSLTGRSNNGDGHRTKLTT